MDMSDRVTLRADDAITAMVALRTSIRRMDELIASRVGDPADAEYRAELFAAYSRIAKALGIPATLDNKPEPVTS